MSVKSDQSIHTAFFYGTLMAPDVFYTVCYGTKQVPKAIADLHTFTPAILHGYCRRRVNGAVYPGMIKDDGHCVRGMYVTGLTRANVVKLDIFEGTQYDRQKVKVRLLKEVGNAKGEGNVEGEEREAETYIYLDKDELEEKEWDFESFVKDDMKVWMGGSDEFFADAKHNSDEFFADGERKTL
ncbi:AIG2-like family-domain-containing protein [Podospora fimiseda]|uniref:Putative gamma-glutamylcyclotransferase n=1 Tax=Podospora fimiseda TaxID=252190 RepID=A0AAN7BM63_9PEZI|nr:AIG2-like family-domain-containing protein [Podospora fimiseda]